MSIQILGPLNAVINKTATEIVDSQLFGKTADVFNTFINAGFEVIDETVKKIQDLTKEEPTP